jgi:hypothetical protein
MGPTIFREKGYRFFIFSREEPRAHIHVVCADGEAKFWLEPRVELAKQYQLSNGQLREIENIIRVHYEEFQRAWQNRTRG